MSSELAKTPQAQEAELAQSYLDTAIRARQVADLALEQTYRDAKAGTLRDPAKTATSAITASAIALDKRLVLQERPTQIIGIDPHAALNALARRVGYIDTTGTDATEQAELNSGFPQSYKQPNPEPDSPVGESAPKNRGRE
jgi:hypothetical protein